LILPVPVSLNRFLAPDFVFFKGRSIIYKDKGEILLLKLAQELEDYGKVEQMPRLEGKRMTMFIAPKKK
jgi:translation initiation factor IF-3